MFPYHTCACAAATHSIYSKINTFYNGDRTDRQANVKSRTRKKWGEIKLKINKNLSETESSRKIACFFKIKSLRNVFKLYFAK
jgi:hypothetical protein